MAENIQFGDEAKGSELALFRLLNDHSQIEVAKPGSGAYTGRSDAELLSKIVGNVQVSAQDDGTYQLQFTIAAYGAEILDFLDNYKTVSSGEKNDFTAWHGELYEAAAASSGDHVFAVIHGPKDPDTGKRLVYAMPCTVEVANSGGHTLQPNDAIEVQVTLQQVKPKQDITFHTGTGSPTTLDPNFVDITAESSDIVAAKDSTKYHYPVTAAA